MGTSKDKIVNDLQQQIKQILANRKHKKYLDDSTEFVLLIQSNIK